MYRQLQLRESINVEAPNPNPNPNDHPEMDESDLLSDRAHQIYLRLIGILQWMVVLGRFDICYSVSSLSRFSSAPKTGHLLRVKRIFGYLQTVPDLSIKVDHRRLEGLPEPSATQQEEMLRRYPDANDERSSRMPLPLGKSLHVTVYSDSDHAHDQVTRRSITGVLVFVGSTPVIAKSSRQTSVETSTFSAEFNAARTASEMAIGLRFLLRSVGVPTIGPSTLLVDNEGVVSNASMFTSTLKKKHNAISFHRVRESIAAGHIALAHIGTKSNLADILTKPLDKQTFVALRKSIMG